MRTRKSWLSPVSTLCVLALRLNRQMRLRTSWSASLQDSWLVVPSHFTFLEESQFLYVNLLAMMMGTLINREFFSRATTFHFWSPTSTPSRCWSTSWLILSSRYVSFSYVISLTTSQQPCLTLDLCSLWRKSTKKSPRWSCFWTQEPGLSLRPI